MRAFTVTWLWAALGLAVPASAQGLLEVAVAAVPSRAIVWPERVAPDGKADAVGVIRPIPGLDGLVGVRQRGRIRTPSEQDLADARALLGDRAAEAEFEGDGSYIYRPFKIRLNPDAANGDDGEAGEKSRSNEYFVFVSATRGREGRPAIERTWFQFHEAKGEARGVALLMPGMFGTPEPILDLLTTRLRGDGWAVLRMLAHPSRFTERLLFELTADAGKDQAAEVARAYDARLAECAYAAQAAMAHIAATHPALAGLPRIAVGMSGGAMVLPTVVAREPDRYAAAVLIAGGCDFFSLTEESNYRYLINAVDFRWTPSLPTDEERARIRNAYLEASALDSYHTASALHGKPVLMLHADHDGAVPARLGDLLWERLGRPERWVERAGHEELFIRLPRKIDEVMTWIAEHGREASRR